MEIRIPYPSAIFGDFHFLTDPARPTQYQAEWARANGFGLTEVSQLMAEAVILREWFDDNGRHLPGRRIEYHFIRYATLLLSWKTRKGNAAFVPEPWFQENVWCLFRSMKEDRSGSCFFGNQNQGKSEFFCLAGTCFGCLHPHSTNQIIMAPVKADRTASIWGRFLEVVKGTWTNCRAKVEALGAEINLVESSGIVYFSGVRPGGFIRLQAAAECGSIQGTKEREDGFLIHYLDEIGNDYPKGGADWLATLPNISSNNRYFCMLSANPRNQLGGLDSEMEPSEGWSSQTEHDYFWKAGQHNINVYRRAGHQSPNFRPEVGGTPMDEALAAADPRDKKKGLHGPFPWLYNGRREAKLLATVSGNRNDPRYKEQAMGMMPAMNLTLRVITLDDVKGSGMDQPFIWVPAKGETVPKISRVAFLDPAKTAGGDRNILTLLEAGWRNDGDEREPVPTIYIREQIELVPTGKRVVDHQWLRDAETIRRKEGGNGSIGDPVPFTRELAMLAALQCLAWNVPFSHFGFDDTMSGEVSFAMMWAFGGNCTTLAFGGMASNRPIMPRKYVGEGPDRRPVVYRDLHRKHVSELYSRLSHWMRGGYLRLNQKAEGVKPDRWIRETIQRLCKRNGETSWDVESKADYKGRKNQISPDYADSLVGALHLIEVKGFIRVEAPVGDGDEFDFGRQRKPFVKDLTMKKFHAA
jgi:hypothetical protein